LLNYGSADQFYFDRKDFADSSGVIAIRELKVQILFAGNFRADILQL
jgi:hypothetical protein